jgi:hypothetical protein
MHSYEDRIRAVELYTGTERKPPLSSWSWDILPQNSWAVGFGFMKRRAIYPGIKTKRTLFTYTENCCC